MYLDIIKFVIALIFLGFASYQDIKTREISNIVWFIMTIFSGSILILSNLNSNIISVILLIAYFYLWYIDLGKLDKYLDIIFFILSILMILRGQIYGESILLLIIFKTLYRINVIKGKADARAMMALTILYPFYPELTLFKSNERYILNIIFPYPIEVLFYAAIIGFLFSFYLFFRNLSKGNVSRKMFTNIYDGGEWKIYYVPFIFCILLGFILSNLFDLFYFLVH